MILTPQHLDILSLLDLKRYDGGEAAYSSVIVDPEKKMIIVSDKYIIAVMDYEAESTDNFENYFLVPHASFLVVSKLAKAGNIQKVYLRKNKDEYCFEINAVTVKFIPNKGSKYNYESILGAVDTRKNALFTLGIPYLKRIIDYTKKSASVLQIKIDQLNPYMRHAVQFVHRKKEGVPAPWNTRIAIMSIQTSPEEEAEKSERNILLDQLLTELNAAYLTGKKVADNTGTPGSDMFAQGVEMMFKIVEQTIKRYKA